jgi:hypothetical protein
MGVYVLKGKPVFDYNMLILAQYRWEGSDALTSGKHTIEFDYTYDGPGIAKGGTGVLKVDGKVVATQKQPSSIAFLQVADETFDVGVDTRTPVNEKDYQGPFAFNGNIDRLTVKLGPIQLTSEDHKVLQKALARASDWGRQRLNGWRRLVWSREQPSWWRNCSDAARERNEPRHSGDDPRRRCGRGDRRRDRPDARSCDRPRCALGDGRLGRGHVAWPVPRHRIARAGIDVLAELAAHGERSPTFRAMLIYNVLIVLYLAYLGTVGHQRGLLLWPAVALYAVVALLLVRTLFADRRTRVAARAQIKMMEE